MNKKLLLLGAALFACLNAEATVQDFNGPIGAVQRQITGNQIIDAANRFLEATPGNEAACMQNVERVVEEGLDSRNISKFWDKLRSFVAHLRSEVDNMSISNSAKNTGREIVDSLDHILLRIHDIYDNHPDRDAYESGTLNGYSGIIDLFPGIQGEITEKLRALKNLN